MRRARPVCLWAAVLLCACDAGGLVWVPVPRPAGAQSVVVAMHLGTGVELYALDLRGGAVALLPGLDLPAGEVVRLEALSFPVGLEALQLEPGLLEAQADGSPLPEAGRRVFAGELAGGAFDAWTEVQEPTGTVRDFAAVPRAPCSRFGAEHFTFEMSSDFAFAVRIDGARALVGTLEGELYLVTLGGARRVTRYPPGLPLGAAVVSSPELVYFAGAEARLWRGTLTETGGEPELLAAPIGTASIAGHVRWLTLFDSGFDRPHDLHALASTGELTRIVGDNVVLQQRLGGETNKAGMVALRRGSVLFGRSNRSGVFRAEDGELVPDSPPQLTTGITGMTQLDQRVFVGAGAGGGVHARNLDGTWESYPDPPLQLDLYSFGMTARGLIVGGAHGNLVEHGLAGWCPLEQIGSGAIRQIVPLDGGWVLAQDKSSDGARTTVTALFAP